MKKKQTSGFIPDTDYEGRDRFFDDVDRMINEGMSAGSVHNREDYQNIEEARKFFEEDPPGEQ